MRRFLSILVILIGLILGAWSDAARAQLPLSQGPPLLRNTATDPFTNRPGGHIASGTQTTTVLAGVTGQKIGMYWIEVCNDANGAQGNLTIQDSASTNLVGTSYDRLLKTFLVRNSWGEAWGDGGHCRMPYEYLIDTNLASDFWTIRAVGTPG